MHDADAIHSEKCPLFPASAAEFILRKVPEATSARNVPGAALAALPGHGAAANGAAGLSLAAGPEEVTTPILGLPSVSYCPA